VSKNNLKKMVLELASKEFNRSVESIPLDSSLILELGIDSLTIAELIMAVEEKLSITIPDKINVELNTLRDIINYVAKLSKPQK